MMKKQILRIIGVFIFFDGLFTLIFGKKFVGLFRIGPQSGLFGRAIEHLMTWSSWQLRAGGAVESAAGIMLLNKAPLEVQTLYRYIAWFYALIDPGWRAGFYPSAHKAFDQAISRHLPQDGHVLDLGCGIGANLSRLLDLNLPFGSYTGVDLSPEMLAEARKRFDQVPHARFFQMNLEIDPLPDGQYDLITSTWVFEHLTDPKQIVYKSWERLKPGGNMVLLFGVSSETIPSRLIRLIYPLFNARLVSRGELESFPGTQSLQQFYGPFGELALVILTKSK